MLEFAAAGLGVLGGIGKMIGGAKRKKRAMQALKRLQAQRQEFTNIHEGRRISDVGAKFAREGIAGQAASSMAALQPGGIRGVVGGMQGVQNMASGYLQNEASQLDEQQVLLDRDKASDEARIQSMKEQRQMFDEQNTQAAINAAQQDISGGMGDITGSLFGAAALSAGAPGTTGVGDKWAQANPFGSMNVQSPFGGVPSAFGNVPQVPGNMPYIGLGRDPNYRSPFG